MRTRTLISFVALMGKKKLHRCDHSKNNGQYQTQGTALENKTS